MSEQDHLETAARRAAAPCPRCAALETERDLARRILRDLLDASEAGGEAGWLCTVQDAAGWLCAAQDAASALLAGIPVVGYEEVEQQRDSARALLHELAAAVRARDGADIARSLRPGDERVEERRFAAGDALLNCLVRAEAEAGGGAG